MQTIGFAGLPGSGGGSTLSGERRLIDRLNSLRDPSAGWYAVRLGLSRIRTIDLQPSVMTLVLKPLRFQASCHDIEIFELSGRDVVVLCRKAPIEAMQSTIDEICRLLRVDAAVSQPDDGTGTSFVTWYDLAESDQVDNLRDWASRLARLSESSKPTTGSEPPTRPRPPSATDLTEMQQKLEEIRIDDLIHRQMALEVQPGARARPVFQETYISIGELRERLGIDVHPAANPCLFQYLTALLDRRMMRALRRDGLPDANVPISLNINVSTIESREFDRFCLDADRARQGTLFEIQFVDALADVGEFLEARDRLRSLGFGVVIDGLDPMALPFVDLAGLGPDLLKIWWSDRIDWRADDERMDAVGDALARFGVERVVLARVDSEFGIKWAKRLGVRRFQGRFIDDVLHTEQRIKRLGGAGRAAR